MIFFWKILLAINDVIAWTRLEFNWPNIRDLKTAAQESAYSGAESVAGGGAERSEREKKGHKRSSRRRRREGGKM